MVDLKLTNEEFLQITGYNNIDKDQITNITDTIFELSVLAYKALNKVLKLNKDDK